MIAELETQLEQAQTMTPEAAVESAIMVYLAAKAQIDEYNRIADAAKKLIGDVMLETGVTTYSTKAGKVSMTSASMSVSYDTKALDALIASSSQRRRSAKYAFHPADAPHANRMPIGTAAHQGSLIAANATYQRGTSTIAAATIAMSIRLNCATVTVAMRDASVMRHPPATLATCRSAYRHCQTVALCTLRHSPPVHRNA